MSAVIAYVVANWMQLLVGAMAVDKFLIPIFPNARILVVIGDFLSSLLPKSGP